MRQINRLNPRKLNSITKVGRHADGGNLYLSISPNGGRRWTFLYRWRGKPTEVGLGSARDVTLARARELAKVARTQLAEGVRPTGPRRPSGAAAFADVAAKVFEARRPSWRNAKHAQQWQMTLRAYAAPLHSLPVDKITTEDVLAVLEPLWATKHETASRLRGRIEMVLDYARAHGMRTGENPARWRGHLDHLLARRPRVAKAHYAALPYVELPHFMARLRAEMHPLARALEFTILTAARSGEVLGARRAEFDLSGKLWTIPGARMKNGLSHEVPLSDRAVKVVASMPEGELVFHNRGKRLHNLTNVLARMGIIGATVHGFRSSFRDWAGDCADFPREVVEAALAHAIRNETEAAYRRSSALGKRCSLMDAWSRFLEQPPRHVVEPGRALPAKAVAEQLQGGKIFHPKLAVVVPE